MCGVVGSGSASCDWVSVVSKPAGGGGDVVSCTLGHTLASSPQLWLSGVTFLHRDLGVSFVSYVLCSAPTPSTGGGERERELGLSPFPPSRSLTDERTRALTHTCTHAHTHTHTHTHDTHTCTHTHMHTHTCTQTHIHTHMHASSKCMTYPDLCVQMFHQFL